LTKEEIALQLTLHFGKDVYSGSACGPDKFSRQNDDQAAAVAKFYNDIYARLEIRAN
jgi:hypothetical protein